ncbi:pseudouridine synthase [Ceraceosorus guamensis]|uniref:Pseudouridine synthase n=1 Tax=Ceraceosorus guamensis TaxID=1522189 RepID=A0A316VY44_9BASI|nr:pseudouridine synthase [Ceraceosorus guamensis]PWN41828.1 pseudouridine synthase [Ceraceosorus guamensis]
MVKEEASGEVVKVQGAEENLKREASSSPSSGSARLEPLSEPAASSKRLKTEQEVPHTSGNSALSARHESLSEAFVSGKPLRMEQDVPNTTGSTALSMSVPSGTDEGRAAREADVGIVQYVSPDLVGLEGGVIKQRFSDFQVFEIAPGGKVCRIVSLDPPTAEQGGDGLYEELETERAEAADSSGNLRQERIQRQNAEREERKAAAEAAKQREAERTWVWVETVDEKAQSELVQVLGQEAVDSLKELWEKGPPPRSSASSGRGWGRGRGRGRGGRGGGRDTEARDAASTGPSVLSEPLTSKEQRTAAHQLVRSVFEGSLQSEALEAHRNPNTVQSKDGPPDDDAIANGEVSKPPEGLPIRITWSNTKQRSQRDNDQDKGGDKKDAKSLPPYVHFLMQKSNRDSHDALAILGRALNLGGYGSLHGKALGDLAIAGTKDKRATTVQRVSYKRGRRTLDEVYKLVNGVGKERDDPYGSRGGRGGSQRGGRGRGGAQRGYGTRKTLLDAVTQRADRAVRIAHLQYADAPLHLGELEGNAFVVTLRNVKVKDESMIGKSVDILSTKGFINYFGLQRFGSGSISSHHTGIELFKGNYQAAVDGILASRPGDSPEESKARQAYSEGYILEAYDMLPRYNVPERAILERMRKDLDADGKPKNDWKGYFLAIPKSLRIMYVHAYQSYVWNRIASERVARYGLDKAIVGDTVALGEDAVLDVDDDQQDGPASHADQADQEAAPGDESKPASKRWASQLPVKVLQAGDLDHYSINDVVIGLPGIDVSYPAGWMADLYKEVLAEDGLTEDHLLTFSDFKLGGAYRKLLQRPKDVSWSLIKYTDTNLNLAQSDEDKLLGIDNPPEPDPEAPFAALQVRLSLPTSCYCTMALREILKSDTSTATQKELTHRGEDNSSMYKGTNRHNRDAVNKVSGSRQRAWGAHNTGDTANATTGDLTDAAKDSEEGVEVKATVSDAFKKEMARLRDQHKNAPAQQEENIANDEDAARNRAPQESS